MKYRVEYCNDPNIIIIHVDLDLSYFLPKQTNDWSKDSEEDDYWDEGDDPFFVKRLLLQKGIVSVDYDRYSIELAKGDIFSWRSILPVIIADLEVVLNRGTEAKRVAKRRPPSLPKKKVRLVNKK